MCGELRYQFTCGSAHVGSSPRVRGTLGGGVVVCRRSPVHPRVCGELARLLPAPGWRSRFIPACAGNSRKSPIPPPPPAVHPRVCGELGRCRCGDTVCGRFIPACAGNSQLHCVAHGPVSVHPRVCGELGDTPAKGDRLAGSSPRVRGTHQRHDQPVRRGRFIPACAGNSVWHRASRRVDAVHPRVCGELVQPLAVNGITRGSSPRVRGTHHGRVGCVAVTRFIPACAGNSMAGWRNLLPKVGSSPRVRGTRSPTTTPC